MSTPLGTTSATFHKATLENPDMSDRRDPGTGLLYSPERVTEVVGTESYDRAIANGWVIIETWTVWPCAVCGMNDSDRDHAQWEVEHFGPISHLDRYGHESVHAAAVTA